MQTTPKFVFTILLLSTVLFSSNFSIAQKPSTTLEERFLSPPDSAQPRTWWHWTGGNVTKEGITWNG